METSLKRKEYVSPVFEFHSGLNDCIYLLDYQVAVDDPPTSTRTESDWDRGFPAVVNNPNLTNLTPVSSFSTISSIT